MDSWNHVGHSHTFDLETQIKMTPQDLRIRNENFQRKAADLVDLMPTGGLLDVTTEVIRSMRLIDKYLTKLVRSTTEDELTHGMTLIEEEIDEVVCFLDRMDMKNRKHKLKVLENFLKEGFDLLSVYSLCCDQIISKRTINTEEVL